jgi:hypothetical protein
MQASSHRGGFVRSCHFPHALAAFAFAAISSPAGAQFYIRFATTLTGTAECDASTVAQAVTGTLDLNLPSAGNNVYESKAVNGGRRPSSSARLRVRSRRASLSEPSS